MPSPTPPAAPPLLPYEWPGTTVMGAEERDAVVAVVEARSPFRYYGPDLQGYADRLEGAYRERLGRRHALAVSSGTAALSVAVSALGLGPGDEVLVPGYLWVSCVSAVVRAGAVPRLVDVDDTFTVDPEALERAVGPHSRALLLVHMSGACGDLDRVLDVARRHGLAVVEDCAQANGASFRGRPLGSFGDLAVFSFQLNKNITAGEGGLVACDDDRLHARAVAAHDLGYPRNAAGRLVTDDAEAQLWGLGARMGELGAAVLCAQEPKLDGIVDRMRAAQAVLVDGIAGVGGAVPRRVPDRAGDSGAFALFVWPDTEACRRIVGATRAAGVRPGPDGASNIRLADFGLHLYANNAALVERRGTDRSGHPWTHPDNAFAQPYDYGPGALPVADDLFERTSLIAVPPSLTAETAREVVRIYRECAAGLGL